MVGRTNYIALVGGSPNRVRHVSIPSRSPLTQLLQVTIWDDAKQKVAITLEFDTPVHRVRLSRTRIVVVLRQMVSLHTFTSPSKLLSTFKTTENRLGLCCLGSQTLAFPGRTAGQVQLVEVDRGRVSIIPAHSTPLRALELSSDGELLATASETVSTRREDVGLLHRINRRADRHGLDEGTLIRVYSTRNRACVAELRRGVDQAVIFDLAISPSNAFIAVTSDKSTLHVFDLPRSSRIDLAQATNHERRPGSNQHPSEDDASRKWGILGKIPILPRLFSDTYSFASAPFEMGDEQAYGPYRPRPSSSEDATLTAKPDRSPSKGVIGWAGDRGLIVIGAGCDARWEKFVIADTPDGRRYCVREGWRRYLVGS